MQQTSLVWALGSLVFLGTFVLRGSDPYLHNDHFFVISGARQVLYGELPFRDFFDEGRPLQHLISASMLGLLGENLLGETLLTVTSVAAAAALTFFLAGATSRSLWVAVAVALAVAFCPIRLQNHWKLTLPLLALALFWGYAKRPTIARGVLLGGGMAAIFLFRHDYGAFVGLAASTLFVAAHLREGPRSLAFRALPAAAVFAALVGPWLLFVQMNGGFSEYVGQFSGYGRTAARLQPIPSLIYAPPRFSVETSAPVLLLNPPRPRPEPAITVRWARGTGRSTRERLEQAHQLRAVEPAGQRAWRYQILDRSSFNVRSLVTDPAVEDTDGIDRTRYQLVYDEREPLGTWLRREVPLFRAALLPGVVHAANATAWLVFLFHAVAVVGLAAVAWKFARRTDSRTDRSETTWALSAVVLLTALVLFIVRGDLEFRVVEVTAPALVVFAWLWGSWGGAGRAARQGRLVVMGALLIGTWASIAVLGDAGRQIERTSVLEGPVAVWRNLTRTLGTVATTPSIDAWAPPGAVGGRALARYVFECTKPTDRLLVLGFASEAYFHSQRLLGGSHFYFREGFWTSPAEQQRALAKLREQPVPVILWQSDTYQLVEDVFPSFHEYIRARYELASESTFGSGATDVWRVLVRRDIDPTGRHDTLGLPCFA